MSAQMMHERILTEWAEPKGMEILTIEGDQREPEKVVVLRDLQDGGRILMKRDSQDSIETACLYMVSDLRRLGIKL